jgi:hypothetical protein
MITNQMLNDDRQWGAMELEEKSVSVLRHSPEIIFAAYETEPRAT